MTKKVFLIGDKNSPKTNQWLQMTNDRQVAASALAAAGDGATFKEVVVPPRRRVKK